MVPDVETRLQVMQRSLREVILPALPPEHTLAREQAGMMIGYIDLILDQHDRQLHLDLAELRDYTRLAQELDAMAEARALASEARAASRAALSESAPFVDVRLPTAAALHDMLRALKAAADDLARTLLEQADADTKDAVGKLVFAHSARQLMRERAWLRKAGFELEPDKLPSLDGLLSE
jgi:hypothetical protein